MFSIIPFSKSKSGGSPNLFVLISKKYEFQYPQTLVGFSFNNTLVQSKTGKSFPTSGSDIELYDMSVLPKIREEIKEGRGIAIVMNSPFPGSQSTKLVGILAAFEELTHIPFICVVAFKNNGFRKPYTKCLSAINFCYQNAPHPHQAPSMTTFVGGDSGMVYTREPNLETLVDTDAAFASNINATFIPSMRYFSKQTVKEGRLEVNRRYLSVDERKTMIADLRAAAQKRNFNIVSEIQNMPNANVYVIMLIAPPCGGKSRIAELIRKIVGESSWGASNSIEIVSREDCKGNMRTMLRKAEKYINSTTHIILDADFYTQTQRTPFIELANRKSAAIMYLVINIDTKLARIFSKVRTAREMSDDYTETPESAFLQYDLLKSLPEVHSGDKHRIINYYPKTAEPREMFYRF